MSTAEKSNRLTSGAQGSAGFVASGDELAYLQRVATGDGHAQRLLASRLVVRVRRAAAAFLPGSVDAEDAAQHALIEILRSAHTYRADMSVERWADELTGRSTLRFARAVRRRGQPTGTRPIDEGVGDDARPERGRERAGLTKLDAILICLSDVRREALLLHHAYGYTIEQISEITQVPLALVRERIVAARRDVRQLADRGRGPTPALERWSELRDRELLGDRFGAAEDEECASLETTDPSVRTVAGLFHEVEMMLNQASLLRPTPADRDLVDQVLRAVRVTSTGGPRTAQRQDPDAELDRAVDPEGPAWIRNLAVGVTVFLIIAAVSALLLHEPRDDRSVGARGESVDEAMPALQVVALVHARTATRGARIHRGGKALAPNSDLREGDVLQAGAGAGCLEIDPDIELCLSPSSELRIASLSRATRSIELLSGRVAGKRLSPSGGEPFTVSAGALHAVLNDALFGLERVGVSHVRVRLIEGSAMLRGSAWSSKLEGPQLGVFRAEDDSVVVEPLPTPQANREWELIATGERQVGPKPADGEPELVAVAEPSGERAADGRVQDAPSKGPDVLLREGWELVKQKRWADAITVYQTLLSAHPKTDEAHVVLIRLGDLMLEHGQAPADALASYDRYLREGGGPLEQEARYGRISALERIGKRDAERAAIGEFMARYPDSAKAVTLRARLKTLETP